MSQDPVFSGSLSGRFYRLGAVLSKGSSFVDLARRQAWVPDGPVLPVSRGFCQGAPPHDGNLGDDPSDLSYQDSGGGIWRAWLREETRKVPKMAIQQRASAIALELDPDTSLSKLQRSAHDRIVDQAKVELMKDVIPNARVIPIVFGMDWLWIGKKGCSTDRSYVHILRQVVGDLYFDPVLWGDGGGWSSCSYATLLAFTRSRGGQLSSDVCLSEVDVKGRSIHLKASDSADEVRHVLKHMTSAVSETSVHRMSFEVLKDGVRIGVDADPHGLYRVSPMRSSGGLPHERIHRRFDDARYAATRVREVMADLVRGVEEEK